MRGPKDKTTCLIREPNPEDAKQLRGFSFVTVLIASLPGEGARLLTEIELGSSPRR